MESSPHTTENAQINRIGKLVYLSFFVSQGSGAFQYSILDWVVTVSDIDCTMLPTEMPQSLSNRKAPHSLNTSTDGRVEEYRTYWNSLADRLRSKSNEGQTSAKKLDRNEVLLEIVKGMVDRDTIYQCKARPGRHSEAKPVSDSMQDPHASFIRRFGLLGKKLDEPIYDELYTEVGNYLTTIRRRPYEYMSAENINAHIEKIHCMQFSDLTRDDISKLICLHTAFLAKLWEQNHPGEKFFVNDETHPDVLVTNVTHK